MSTTQQCTTTPEQAHIPAVPTRVEIANVFAWDAGANSIETLDGDVVTRFTMGKVIGVVIGFTADREQVADYARMTHALYFHQTNAGQPRVRVIEAGQALTAPASYGAADGWEIRRINGMVSYWRNGVVIYTSRRPSRGALSVGSALYATGDFVGEP